jgi:hypothetical protein
MVYCSRELGNVVVVVVLPHGQHLTIGFVLRLCLVVLLLSSALPFLII